MTDRLPNETSSEEDMYDSRYELIFSTPLAQSTAYEDLPAEGNEFDTKPPLLAEVDSKPKHIYQKTLFVLNLLGDINDQSVLEDTDMTGPLVFCLALGIFLLLAGKMTFSVIYGIGFAGCIFLYLLLSLRAIRMQVTFMGMSSMLGYCLPPMVVLSFINIFITIEGTYGIILAILAVVWCSLAATNLLATAFDMEHQQVLIAFNCAMFYGGFAMITLY